MRVLVLIDTSGGMKGKVGDSLSEIAILTTAFAVDSTPANARIAIGRFAELLQLPRWTNRNSAGQQIMSLKVPPAKRKDGLAFRRRRGDASAWRCRIQRHDLCSHRRRRESQRHYSQRRLVQNLITDGIRTFVFVVNTSDFKTPEVREGSHNVEELAGQTGGFASFGRKSGSAMVSVRLWRSKSSVQRPRLII